jgi:hypothetical protein
MKPVLKILLIGAGLYVLAAAIRTMAGVAAVKKQTGGTPSSGLTGQAFLNALSDPANIFNYNL